MPAKFFKNNRTGFTLIETILYLAIVGIILTSVIEFSMTLGRTTSKLGSNIDVSRDRRLSLNIISYLIRNADGFLKDTSGDCSSFGVTPPILALYFNNDTWLPGTCVENGGGVKITISSNRIKMTCYPNITNNGQYGACSATAGNSYWLTGPDLMVTNTDLTFATSTATSTLDGFRSITTHVKVSVPSAGQVNLQASSAATSTEVLRNEQPSGLISWWKFDETDTATAADSISGYNLTCTGTGGPSSVDPLINGSSKAFDFNVSDSDSCSVDNPEKLNLGNSFTISVWFKTDSPGEIEHTFIDKNASSIKGYYFYNLESWGEMVFYLCDGTTCESVFDVAGVVDDATVYNITIVYDQPNDSAKMLIFKKGVGGVSTTTASSLPFLVNDSTADYPRIGYNFEGTMDDFRIYGRALTDKEIWALQSAGN
ncbi:MAG: LamG-like jellyroll fold domain-containing protein [Patescibacteria group bacterium]